jgi:hypothetical protein
MWRWIVSLIHCRGKHRYIMHFLGEKKTWECTRCGRVFPISESLTRASGAFTPEARERAREIPGREQKKPTKAQDMSRKKGA